MKPILTITLAAITLSACGVGRSSGPSANSGKSTTRSAISLTEDEKHRLYTAALAASESPMDTDLFKEVCKKIGIFDADGVPNDNYMPFVQAHVDWAMKPETEQFKREINSKEKAGEYINKYLPR